MGNDFSPFAVATLKLFHAHGLGSISNHSGVKAQHLLEVPVTALHPTVLTAFSWPE